MDRQIKDLALRFILGGASVAACYILVQVIPWKSFAGIFAAFPAVMVAAVIMAGVFQGSKDAGEVALGAVAGMMGCTVCVITSYLIMAYTGKWGLALVIALIAWFVSSALFIKVITRIQERRLKRTDAA
ncbi:MAG: DUF3147 family protein [Bacillota bacterium]|nr:DUF3147 family protein [Bacillota bacterium]